MAEEAPPTSPPPVETPAESSSPPGESPADWRAGFPEDLRTNATIQNAATPLDAAKMLIHAESLVGADKVPIPQKTWTPEQHREFFAKIGCPEKGEDYQLPQNGLPEGMQLDTDRIDAFRTIGIKLGITDQQFAGLIRAEMEQQVVKGQQDQVLADQGYESAVNQLRGDFGPAAFDQEIAFSQHAVEHFGGERTVALNAELAGKSGLPTGTMVNPLQELLIKKGLDVEPLIVHAFNKVGHMIAEDQIMGTGPQTLLHTPASADIAIAEKLRDKEFRKSYYDASHPLHQAAVDEMWALQQARTPEPAPPT